MWWPRALLFRVMDIEAHLMVSVPVITDIEYEVCINIYTVNRCQFNYRFCSALSSKSKQNRQKGCKKFDFTTECWLRCSKYLGYFRINQQLNPKWLEFRSYGRVMRVQVVGFHNNLQRKLSRWARPSRISGTIYTTAQYPSPICSIIIVNAKINSNRAKGRIPFSRGSDKFLRFSLSTLLVPSHSTCCRQIRVPRLSLNNRTKIASSATVAFIIGSYRKVC